MICWLYVTTAIFRPCSAAQTCTLDAGVRTELNIEASSCTSDDSVIPIGKKCAYVCEPGYFSVNSGEEMTCGANDDKTSAKGKWKVPGVGCKRA